jgi:hypothetical protein
MKGYPMSRISKRLPLAASALLTLLFGLWGGLLRVQWHLPVPQANWVSFHGPLMVGGFFGTLISLARSSMLGHRAGLLVPLTAALGAWTLLLGGPENWGAALFLAASLGYLLICLGFFKKQPAYAAALALAGGCGWAWSNYFWWRGEPIPRLMAGWQSLFVLTVASERLEAVRWQTSRVRTLALLAAAGTLVSGILLQPFQPAWGARIAGAGFILLALCLLTFDRGWSGANKERWKGYTQACLISGYAWLLAGGFCALFFAPVESGFAYDAALHCVFLGLVFSMVFSHVPLLLSRVLKTPLPFHSLFYGHWFLLQASLMVRVGGDAMGSSYWRQWGSMLNAFALLLFILNTALAVKRGKRKGE